MKYWSVQCPLFNSWGGPESVRIEVAIRGGLPGLHIFGVAPSVARNTAERIRCAFQMSGIKWPYRTVVAEIGDHDPALTDLLDLPLAGCLLACLGYQVNGLQSGNGLLGRMNLSGRVQTLEEAPRHLAGAGILGYESLQCNTAEARLLLAPGAARPRPINHLNDLFAPLPPPLECDVAPPLMPASLSNILDTAVLNYSRHVWRAAVACAEARHSMLILGPPGAGKSLLAQSVYYMLPPPSEKEQSVLALQSGSEADRFHRPLRRPHHSITRTGLIGGGSPVRPGELSRSSHGMLLLDEMGEFQRQVLQALREPMESGEVHLSRGQSFVRLPFRSWVVGTSNACPCGLRGSANKRCLCTDATVESYLMRILGPLQDRMDLQLFIQDQELDVLDDLSVVEQWRCELWKAQRQSERGYYNGELPDASLEQICRFENERVELVWKEECAELSHRKRNGIRRLARTFADMSGAAWIQMEHLLEALRHAPAASSQIILQGNAKVP
ncbi:MAG: ATP-binding protein [Leptospiraceae bacterium]|nr:ATP-binding protein [Leptospiraceae bacterium]